MNKDQLFNLLVEEAFNKEALLPINYTPCIGDEYVKKLSDKFRDFYPAIMGEEIYVGGYRGGNCWNSTEPHYESVEVEDKSGKMPINFLIDFLEKYFPSTSIRTFASIINAHYSHKREVREYYGNTSEYITRVILIKDIVDILCP